MDEVRLFDESIAIVFRHGCEFTKVQGKYGVGYSANEDSFSRYLNSLTIAEPMVLRELKFPSIPIVSPAEPFNVIWNQIVGDINNYITHGSPDARVNAYNITLKFDEKISVTTHRFDSAVDKLDLNIYDIGLCCLCSVPLRDTTIRIRIPLLKRTAFETNYYQILYDLVRLAFRRAYDALVTATEKQLATNKEMFKRIHTEVPPFEEVRRK
jgi:hypothetical protein